MKGWKLSVLCVAPRTSFTSKSKDEVEYLNIVPEIDTEMCNGCAVCTRIGHCMVLSLVDEKAKVVKKNECYGCGVCYWICPKDAISMVNEETGEKMKLPAF